MDFVPMEFLWGLIKQVTLSDSVLLTAVIAPLLLVFELWRPARVAPLKHYRFGFSFFAFNAVVLVFFVWPITGWMTAKGVQALGFGFIDLSTFGLGGVGGSLLAVVTVTFCLDFFYYWFHRTLHYSPLLWHTHVLHHSDEHMNMLTAQRGHFFEGLLSPLFTSIPLAVFFKMPAVEIAVLSLIPSGYLLFAHANLNVGFGPLWWLMISPNFHRIHHSIEPQHQDKNFTNWFPIWDILFGTVWRPRLGEIPATGVAGVRVATLRQAYWLPISGWRSLWQSSPSTPSAAEDRLK